MLEVINAKVCPHGQIKCTPFFLWLNKEKSAKKKQIIFLKGKIKVI